MPKRIEFEGKVHEFPDDFTDADIAKALGPAEKPGFWQGVGEGIINTPGRMIEGIKQTIAHPLKAVANNLPMALAGPAGKAVQDTIGTYRRMHDTANPMNEGGQVVGEGLTDAALTLGGVKLPAIGKGVMRAAASPLAQDLVGVVPGVGPSAAHGMRLVSRMGKAISAMGEDAEAPAPLQSGMRVRAEIPQIVKPTGADAFAPRPDTDFVSPTIPPRAADLVRQLRASFQGEPIPESRTLGESPNGRRVAERFDEGSNSPTVQSTVPRTKILRKPMADSPLNNNPRALEAARRLAEEIK